MVRTARMFDEHDQAELDLEDLKVKLVHCTNHAHAIRDKRALIAAFLGREAKWYEKAGRAVADAVKWKSVEPLYALFGDEWEKKLAEISAFDPAAVIKTGASD